MYRNMQTEIQKGLLRIAENSISIRHFEKFISKLDVYN